MRDDGSGGGRSEGGCHCSVAEFVHGRVNPHGEGTDKEREGNFSSLSRHYY